MKALILIGLIAVIDIRADAIQRQDVNARQVDGMTALHWAAQKEDARAVKALLKAGADAKATNRYGVPPLWIACQNGNGEIVKMLLEAGADANTAWRGDTVLMTAARTGKVGPVQALLERGASVNARERHGQTALMWAAAEGHVAAADLLIKAGADWKTPLEGGFTPFFFAVRAGRAEVVNLLLQAGADVNEPMHPRQRGSHGPQAGMRPLLMAVENGHFELAIHLVKAGANPNDQRGGYTALHNIVWVRKPTNGEGDDGTPPPVGSGRIGSLQFVREIVALGAKVNERITNGPGGKNAVNWTGATPFLFAAKTADLELLKVLYELGADPLTTNVDGDTAVIACSGVGTRQIDEVAETEEEVLSALEWLLRFGIDINAVDKNGETAMHGAAYKGMPRVVEYLAAHGAKIEVWHQRNKWGWTPLMIAEGYRTGCFSPSFKTVAAFHKVMLAAGLQPPVTLRDPEWNNDNYAPKKAK